MLPLNYYLKIMYYLLLLTFFITPLAAIEPNNKVVVHNRILAQVNGKSISMVDVVKQLDMLLYRNQPEMRNNPEARIEFYKTSWKPVMRDIIDRELVLADAQEKQFEVSNGDIREEMEEMFGPDVIKNVTNAGLTVPEAKKMIRSDILLRRMLYFRVRLRAYSAITPQEIEKAYNVLALDQGAREEVVWSAITFKSTNEQDLKRVAVTAFDLLKQGKAQTESLKETLAQAGVLGIDSDVTISVSPPFSNPKRELSKELSSLFTELAPGEYSQPKMHRGRSDSHSVWKIYCLKEKSAQPLPPLSEVEPQIREELTARQVEVLSDEYITNLRKHFGVNYDEIEREHQDFEPFK